jgi:tetratricopeptide (TPR) repeat protein
LTQTLFLSYSWNDTSIADKLDNIFQPTGLEVKRDIRYLGYKNSIKDFMTTIRDTDFALLIISDNFIKSANCMYEVLELVKEKNYKDRVLPVVMDGTKIYSAVDRLAYIQYWTKQYKELQVLLSTIKPTDVLELLKELKHIENIKTNIDEFLAYISDVNIPRYSSLSDKNFKPILDYIGVSDKELISKILSIAKLSTDDEKEIALDNLETEYPNNAKVFVAKAINCFRIGKIPVSSHYYRKSIAIDSTFSPAFYNLAFNVEVYEKNYSEAKRLLEIAIKLSPNDVKSLNNLAGLYSKELSNPEKAKELYEKVIAIKPNDFDAHYNLATLIAREFPKDNDIAKEHYETAIDINPEFVEALHNYAILLSESYEDFNGAINSCLRILEIEPERKETLKLIGSLYEFDMKDFTLAKTYYDRFIAITPNTAKQHNYYVMFLIAHCLPEFKELAIEHYEAACELDHSFKNDATEIFLYDL